MIIKSKKEEKILKKGGQILARILSGVAKYARAGISTEELNRLAEEKILKAAAIPAFKGYKVSGRVFPASLCVSINDEIVHGLPGARVLEDGDIVGLDLGIKYKGLFTDSALTVVIGKGDKQAQKLIAVCREALFIGIQQCRDGAHIGDVGHAIQSFVEAEGFQVVKELVGHGVGRRVHEEPMIPNYGKKGSGSRLKEGMVIALEPIIVEGRPQIFLDKDGWTWRTKDGSGAAHFEHTLLVTKNGAVILTRQSLS